MSAPRRAVARCRQFPADGLTPLSAYRRLSALSTTRFLFESVSGGEQVSRFSFLGAAPRELYRLYRDRLERERDGVREALPGPPLEALGRVLGGIRADRGPIPFTGGFVGYFGYDLVRFAERLPGPPPDPFGLPVALLARMDNLLVFDHVHQHVLAIANEIDGEVGGEAAERALDQLQEALDGGGRERVVALPEPRPALPAEAAPTLSAEEFGRAVTVAQEHIAAGDIFQVVLARRWRVPRAPDPRALYRAARLVNPSPYMVLLETPDVALVGSSPEMLVRKTGRRIETRPIAGTRPRGGDGAADRRLAQELLADPKERAEHVMLVDLGRNDVGRVAERGTVRVASFLEVERYSHVMHLVSSVEGELAPGREALDALLACFPAGTVSGAPKIRAMEIIDQLEPEARGPYAGAVGYLSWSGDLDTCITIRTMVCRDGETSITAGAGIVADSDPAREAQETRSKAAGLLSAFALAEELSRREGA
jgi:anthranilate synthase component 1